VLGKVIGRFLFGFGVAVACSGPAVAELATTGAPVAMRAGPAGNARIVQRIPARAEVELAKCSRGWRQASWRNRSGYVPCSAVVLGPPPATLPGNEMPPPVVNALPTYVTPPASRWTGAYVGGNFGFGSGAW
jgi:Bacterial SH3 domain